ncbi:DUF559 domain-containing protein [Novosphingobium profundi]|uniref:endonuclease domain-containing protein n=1 Tax=Novosphingobium profundi TaxID=1774954 RepID=UPI001BDA70F1|nr:DUF559 domain-containing protein [Novosphingobium profundi]MBT0668907.1 DUF559 domain-containing protein [Novosphingobium profundi]
MTAERKTLGVSRADTGIRGDARQGFVLTGARYEKLKERAREQRHHPSEAQALLWEELRGSKLGGVKFIRQAIVGSAIVDFACPARWIAVQITPEGANAEVATLQDGKLIQVGVRLLRFAEADVLGDTAGVVQAITAEVNKPFDKRAARRGVPMPRFDDTGAEG